MNYDIRYLEANHLISRNELNACKPCTRVYFQFFASGIFKLVQPIAIAIEGGACMVNATVRGRDQYAHADGFYDFESTHVQRRDGRWVQRPPRTIDLIGPDQIDPNRNGGVGYPVMWEMISDHVGGETLVIETWMPEECPMGPVAVSLFGIIHDIRREPCCVR